MTRRRIVQVAAVGGAVVALGLAVSFKPARPEAAQGTERLVTQAGSLRRNSSSAPIQPLKRVRLAFEPNSGQTDPQAKFVAQGDGYVTFLTRDGMVLSLASPRSEIDSRQLRNPRWQLASDRWRAKTDLLHSPLTIQNSSLYQPPAPNPESQTPSVVRLKLVGANPDAKFVALDKLRGISNYLIGNDPKKWRTRVPNYARVLVEDVYPGIDMVFYGKESVVRSQESVAKDYGPETKDAGLEYDIVVHPGADPNRVAMQIETGKWKFENGKWIIEYRHSKIEDAASSDIVIPMSEGQVRLGKPEIYQLNSDKWPRMTHFLGLDRSGHNSEMSKSRYIIAANGDISISVGSYDRTRDLVIDPTINYLSTFNGGPAGTQGKGIAVDSGLNAYIVGSTGSTFPTTGGAFQTTSPGSSPAFVRKIDPTGAVVYSTYLGGSGVDLAYGVAVDSQGDAYVTGGTSSTDFPVLNAFQPSLAGGGDAFVTELDPTGSALVYSSYLGGSLDATDVNTQNGSGIAVDTTGSAYLTGITRSSDFPTVSAFQPVFGGGQCPNATPCSDGFVTKVAPEGGTLLYSTFLGGSQPDFPSSIAVDASGNAYVAGGTDSTDFPVLNAFQSSCPTKIPGALFPCGAAFVSELNPTGSSLVFSTYLGGSNGDEAFGISLDSGGNIYVAGGTASSDFPTATPIQTTLNGPIDVFVTEFNPGASQLVYSTFLGGNATELPYGLAVDSFGEALVTGWTTSPDYPVANPIQGTLGCSASGTGSCTNVFVTALQSSGKGLAYSTYLGNGEQMGFAIATDSAGDAWITGASGTATFAASISRQQAFSRRPTVDALERAIPAQAGAGATQALAGSIALDMSRISASPASLSFGPQLVSGTTASRAVTLSNPGTAPLQFSDIAASNSFSVASGGTCSTSGPVAPNSNCTVNVAFAPTVGGNLTGTLTLTDNGIGSPHTVPLSGTGQDFGLSTNQNSATVAPGGTASYSLSFAPQGGLTGTVTLACTGAPSGATCTVPGSVTLDGTNAATATAVVRTTAASLVAPHGRFGPPSHPLVVLFILVPFAVFIGSSLVSAKKRSPRISALKWAFLTSTLFIALFWAGCGGGNNTIHNPGTPAGTYSLTVTARTTSGAATDTHTITLTLNVT